MTRQPRVSVCIPTIDRPDLLREAIASVAAQTWRDFEVVISDNSGDPTSQARTDGIMAEFPDLSFVLRRHPVQVDAIENFNSLIDEAKGELWACLPDDDRFCPDFLALSVEALDRHPECAFTFADHWIMRADGTIDEGESARNTVKFSRNSLREGVYAHRDLFPLVLRQALCLQTALFRLPVVRALRFVPGVMAGDHSFFLRLATNPEPFDAYYVNRRLFEYRIHGSQITSTTGRKDLIRGTIASFETVTEVPPQYLRAFRAKLGRCYLALALLEAEDGELQSALAHAKESLRLSPNLRAALGTLLVAAAPSAVRSIRDIRQRLNTIGARRPQ